jgi:hypothetical protein
MRFEWCFGVSLRSDCLFRLAARFFLLPKKKKTKASWT